MRVMGIHWLLLTTCVLSCMTIRTCDSAQGKEPSVGDSVVHVFGSFLGFKPCLDESCGSGKNKNYAPRTSVTPDQDINEEDYEPQEHVENPKDVPVVHCIKLRPSTLRKLGVLESRHPDICAIKYKIIEQMINSSFSFSSFRVKNCSSEVKLLDIIVAAATELREDYINSTRDNCEYIAVDESEFEKTTAVPVVTSSPYRPTESTSMPTESSKVPCPESAEESDRQTMKPCPEQREKPVTKLPELTTPKSQPSEKTRKPCPVETSTTGVTEEQSSCPEGPYGSEESAEEIIAEDYDERPTLVGSIRGIPGIHYPNYSDVPITSFTCADKKHIPGFYADLETGCQVFHMCYEHRRESFLCPVGTIFNQPILACDYWYSSNCSLAPSYYDVNAKTDLTEDDEVTVVIDDLVSVIVDSSETAVSKPQEQVLEDISKFLPVKAKVVEYPQSQTEVSKPEVQEAEDIASDIFDKIISTATVVASKTKDLVNKIPEPSKPVYKSVPVKSKVLPVFKVKPLAVKAPLAKAAITKAKLAAALPSVVAKAKLAAAVPVVKAAAVSSVAAKAKLAAAVPVVKAAAVSSVAAKAKLAAVPVIAKAKLATSAVPVAAKAKLAAVAPKVIAKASIPALKAKMIASAVPLAKAKILAPVLKGKALKTAALPLVKAKMLAIPLVKSKLVGGGPILKAKMLKAAAISPLTKKALALGYMKLLKAKKLALMG